ncbi:MAG: TonB-dependent receptor [Vicingaceae bacterium]
MRKYFTLLVCLIGMSITAFSQVGQGSLQGKIIDGETGEALPFANVAVEQNGNPAGGSTTDFDGKFSIKPLSPGKYTLKASYVGFQTVQINNVTINSNQVTFQNINLKSEGGVALEEVVVAEFADPLIKKDDNTQGGKISREQFDRLPTRSVGEAQAIVPGTVSDPSGGTSIRGSRGSGNQTFIDGIKVRGGTNLPRAAVEEIQVLTGGIPAEVGDITGGATFVTTRGASTSSFTTVEVLSSGFGYKSGLTQKTWGLDNQGYNLLGFTYGGPILRKKDENGVKKEAIMSFIFTSEFIDIVDTRPSIIGTYKMKDAKLNELIATPYMTPGQLGGNSALSGTVLRSEYTVNDNDMELVKTRQNARSRDINLQSNVTVNTSKNTTLRFGGTFFNSRSDVYTADNAMYNFYNNPARNDRSWRAYGRFTQRFANPVDEEGNVTESAVKNAYVSLQVDYEQFIVNGEDPDHGDDFFRYGYVGKFQSVLEKSYNLEFYEPLGALAYVQDGFNQTNWNYTYSDINPDLANYTKQYYGLYTLQDGSPDVEDNYDNINNVRTFTLINGSQPRNVYQMWRGHGFSTGANGQYFQFNNNQFRLSASGAADLKSHEIKVGFEFEQRIDRGYVLSAPNGLWDIGRQEVNFHIQELDSIPQITYIGGVPYVDFERRVGATDQYGLSEGQFLFDYKLRQALGLNPNGNDFVDFDSYDPSSLKIEYFSADELITNNSGIGLSYFGYDHTGSKQSGTPTLDDFFNETDEFGKKTRRIDAFRPIYAAGYIQDKFTFDDLIFRVGLRVDYFDANQPVLKDAYSLFPTVSAAEIRSAQLSTPSNVGSDWVVYVNANNTELVDVLEEEATIIGYRNPEDNTWYDANGTLVGRASDLTGGSGNPFPLLQDGDNVSTEADLGASSFEDYKPQITPMPRISFSFPVSDEASFFANYDVLISRPTSFLQFRPTDYLFLGSSTGAINNPNLRPERTITYELGFKQALNKNTALSLSAFYREMRDQIQAFRFDGAYPVTYTSFENLDFGTVQGFTIAYDLRRIKNVYLTANYTLQIAQGTGSNASSQLNLVNAGNPNLRNITYLNYDRRHNFNVNFDFHYGDGKNYNGPKIGGKDVFSNAGFNVVASGGSGSPFTKWRNTQSQVIYGTPSGFLESNFNSSRLPWNFNLNARFDKRFKVEFGSKANDNRKFAWLEVYLQVLNLLNSQNILGVWASTGTSEDDGYLSEAQSQPVIQSSVNPSSYVDQYQARIHNPGFFSTQRRARLGLVLNF